MQKKPDFSKDKDFEKANKYQSVNFNKFAEEADEARILTKDMNQKKFEKRIQQRRMKRFSSYEQLRPAHFQTKEISVDVSTSRLGVKADSEIFSETLDPGNAFKPGIKSELDGQEKAQFRSTNPFEDESDYGMQ